MLAKFPREHEHRRLTASYNGTSYDVPIRRSLLLEIIPRSFVQFLPKLLRSIFVTLYSFDDLVVPSSFARLG